MSPVPYSTVILSKNHKFDYRLRLDLARAPEPRYTHGHWPREMSISGLDRL